MHKPPTARASSRWSWRMMLATGGTRGTHAHRTGFLQYVLPMIFSKQRGWYLDSLGTGDDLQRPH